MQRLPRKAGATVLTELSKYAGLTALRPAFGSDAVIPDDRDDDATSEPPKRRGGGEEEGRPDLSGETSRRTRAGPPIRPATRSCTYTR